MEYSPVRIEYEIDMPVKLSKYITRTLPLVKSNLSAVLITLITVNVLERAKVLLDKFALKRVNDHTVYIGFLNCTDWCTNGFLVTNQVSMEGNRVMPAFYA